MNFQTEFELGQSGGNMGTDMGPGLFEITKYIGGIQKERKYVVAGAAKSGKSTYVNYGFVISPYIDSLKTGEPLRWIYYSYEIPRVAMEFDFAAYFLYHDYEMLRIGLPPGVTRGGKDYVLLSSNYLRGRLMDDDGKIIKCKDIITEKLFEVYHNRILPLFGKWSKKGICLESGLILFIDKRENPTGIYKHLKACAAKLGQFQIVGEGKAQRTVGYIPFDPKLKVIAIIDHMRKPLLERGFDMKKNIDKLSEYTTEIRNLCGFAFVEIIHLNRNLATVQRLKESGEYIFPNGDDIKDSGNLTEDADYVFTVFDANDERYRLTRHFGTTLRSPKGGLFHPNRRTIHLVESRHIETPRHFEVNMLGNVKSFNRFTF